MMTITDYLFGKKYNECHGEDGRFCSGSGSDFSSSVDESLRFFQAAMRQQFAQNKNPYFSSGSLTTQGSTDIEQAKSDIIDVIRQVDNSGEITVMGNNMINLSGSDKFAMLGVGIESNGNITLRQIYMHDSAKGKGPTGPASQLYRNLGKVAEGYGDGKLHVYSAGEYTKQKKFWDQVPNAVME